MGVRCGRWSSALKHSDRGIFEHHLMLLYPVVGADGISAYLSEPAIVLNNAVGNVTGPARPCRTRRRGVHRAEFFRKHGTGRGWEQTSSLPARSRVCCGRTPTT